MNQNSKKRNIKKWLFVLILLFIVTIISYKIMLQKELKIDKIAYNVLVEKLRNPNLTIFMKWTTKLGNPFFIILSVTILTIFFITIGKNKKIACLIPANLTLSFLINCLFKLFFRRERPMGYRIIEMTGYSFPSGHAMVSMAFYGLLIYLIYHLVKNKSLKVTLITINILIITLIGISRVYLGVHYLSDVITGYAISILYLMFLTKNLKKYNLFP